MTAKKIIIDTDGAVDDVRAISLALQTPGVEVLAITTVHGVVGVDQVVANVSRALRANNAIVPIYKGASEPLISAIKSFYVLNLFGKDGNSDQPDKFPKVLPKDFTNYEPNKAAAIALIDLLKEHRDVTLICIGPLTNVALALKLDPEFSKLPQEMVIMGGNVYGVGNVGSLFTSEFNFGTDPEAAHIVLDRMRCPITIVPWEAAFFEDDSLNRRDVNFHEHLSLGTPLAEYLTNITTMIRGIRAKEYRQHAFVDEIAVGAAVDASKIIKESKSFSAVVEIDGKYTRGQIACDWTNGSVCERNGKNSKPKIKFITKYNATALNEMIIAAVRNSK